MKVLFCSIAFPPKSDPECLQTAKYFYYLCKDEKLEIDVITSSIPTLFMDEDNSLERYNTGWRKKYEIKIPENKYINGLLRKISPFGIDFPDSKFWFHWKWKSAIKKIESIPDIIYSRSYPLSSTLLAYHLSKSYDVPWIMHLSDPWSISPLHTFNRYQYKWHIKWEKKCFEKARKICLTSERTLDFYKEVYPEFTEKFDFFPNVYDPNELINNPIRFDRKLRFVYTGGLIKDRSIKWFLPVFRALKNKYPYLKNDCEFVFAGNMDLMNRNLFMKHPFPFVKHIGNLSYEKALELQKSGHILINIDNPIDDPKKAVFFPSKLLDYFLAQRRILCLTNDGSSSYFALKNYLADVCENHNIPTIMKYIETALYEWKHKNKDFFRTKELPERYSAVENAARLASLIKKYETGVARANSGHTRA